jgi:hypothetical protein
MRIARVAPSVDGVQVKVFRIRIGLRETACNQVVKASVEVAQTQAEPLGRRLSRDVSWLNVRTGNANHRHFPPSPGRDYSSDRVRVCANDSYDGGNNLRENTPKNI